MAENEMKTSACPLEDSHQDLRLRCGNTLNKILPVLKPQCRWM